MKLSLLVLLLLLTGSCAKMGKISSRSGGTREKSGRTEPLWVYSPTEFCGEAYLCAVGEGAGLMVSEANARNGLSKIFETKISSTTNIYTSNTSQTDGDGVLSGSTNQDVDKKVSEETNQLLKGVEIFQTYQSRDAVYALARLNKKQAANRLADQLLELEDQITSYYKDGRRSSLAKALKLYKVVDTLNERHFFLDGSRVKGPISLRQILKKKKEKRALGIIVGVSVKELSKKGELEQSLLDHLSDNDFKVVNKKGEKFHFKLKGFLKKEKMHMKVKGFSKFKFLLQLRAENYQGEKVGSLSYSTTQTGRDFIQAYENAFPVILKFLDEHFDELNID